MELELLTNLFNELKTVVHDQDRIDLENKCIRRGHLLCRVINDDSLVDVIPKDLLREIMDEVF